MNYDYETSPQGIKFESHERNINHQFLFSYISKLLSVKKSIKILEIGCGGGRNLLALKQKFKNQVKLYGTDISQVSLDYARKLKIGMFARSDSKEIPFKEKFDLILMIDLLEHLKTKKAAVETLNNAKIYLKNSLSCLYLCVPVEKNPFTFTWFYQWLPYFKDLTKVFYGHLLPFDTVDIAKMINKKYYKVDRVFYSVHFISQLQTLLFYFVSKSLLRLFLGKKVEEDLRDSSEVLGNNKHPLLSLIKKFDVGLGRSLSWLAFQESRLRRNSSFGAGSMHLMLKKG